MTRVLVLGATGLLGNAVFRGLSRAMRLLVLGTARNATARHLFRPELAARLLIVEDLENPDVMERAFDEAQPDVVVNCTAVGRPAPADPMRSISIHSVLPHRLSRLCRLRGGRLVQISSDGVFSGARGAYTEGDLPDASDIYGISKVLGEVAERCAITLRTSIIGHELQAKSGLLEWFLSQQETCRCYTRVMFSGFPTNVLAEIIRDVVIPHPELYGVYHVATRPISKFDLLQLVARRYAKTIRMIPDDSVVIDRSLVADRFAKATGYVPPDWPALVDSMFSDRSGLAGV